MPHRILCFMAVGSVLPSTCSYAEGGRAASALYDLPSEPSDSTGSLRREGGWAAGEAGEGRQHLRARTGLGDVTSAPSQRSHSPVGNTPFSS